MKKLLLIFSLVILFLTGCSSESSDYIVVKYRDTPVEISKFKTINTSSSSFIEKAYYDLDNKYLVLNLNGTNYHRCDVPEYIWNEFKNADSFGKYYNKYIKGEYDCRLGYVPEYD